MSVSSYDVAARRQAMALRECPFRSEAEIRAEAASTPLTLEAQGDLAASQKPEIYARLAPYIDRTLDNTFALRESLGGIGLLTPGDDVDTNGKELVRPARANEVGYWDDLRFCWSTTLEHFLDKELDVPSTDPAFLALKALWAVRKRPKAMQLSLGNHLRGGITTAVFANTATAYGMSAFLEDKGKRGTHKKQIMRASSGPLVQLADLEMEQLSTYSTAFLGEHIDGDPGETYVYTRYDEINTDVYELLGHDRVAFNTRPEQRRTPAGVLIARVLPFMHGPRIGCPIRLTPGQAQKLWGAYIDTAATAGLLQGNPAQYA